MNEVVPVTPEVLSAFLAVYGEAERADLEHLGGPVLVERAVGESVHTFAGLVDGVPAFLGGVIAEGNVGRVWMLGAPGIANAKKFYLSETRRQTELMQEMFPRLQTGVSPAYPKSLRWLRWLGFVVGEPVGYAGGVMIPVERVA